MAATAPKTIEASDKKIIIVCHWSIRLIKGIYKNLINTVIAAIFGKIAKKIVTDVGDPWYTSGAHIWNGTAEILKASPTKINTIPSVRPYWTSLIFWLITKKLVDPEYPYIKEHPYSNRPEDNALKTKYFSPDSEESWLSLLNEAKTYKAKDCYSKPI